MESLFLMQRYWGSDDENEDIDKKKDNSVSNQNNEGNIPSKKRKLDISGVEIKSENDIEFDEEIQTLPNKKYGSQNKKLKSCFNQVDSVSNFDSFNEHNEVSFKKETDSEREVFLNANILLSKGIGSSGKKIKSKKEKKGKLNDNSKNVDISSCENLNSTFTETGNELEIINGGASDVVEKESLLVVKKASSSKRKLKEEKCELKDKSSLENGIKADPFENKGDIFQNDGTFCTIGQICHQKQVKVKHSLPSWLINPTYISVNLLEEEVPVSELNYLDKNTKNNLTNAGINYLFPVQLAVIPWLMQSKERSLVIRPSDICVSAPTGSGKTLAFVLPIVQSLKDRVVCAIRALVVLPVSELAIQVYKVFETFIRGTDLKVALLTGKKSFIAEQNALIRSNDAKVKSLVDIVVTTPGRIYDHMHKTKGFCLKRLKYLVIDEADRMMGEIQQGWLKQVEDAVFRNCTFANCVCSSVKRTSLDPSSAFNFGFIPEPLQKLLYSATLTHDPEQLHSLSLYRPKLFTASSPSSEQEITGTCVIPSGLQMLQVVCEEGIKPMIICHLVKHHDFKKVLCFTETVERAHRLHLVLEEMSVLKVREISALNTAIQRKIVLEQFSRGLVDILVCSDLVARGIDIDDVDCVISYDVPQFIKTHVHRIGRTARAGKTGTAITLLSDGEMPHFKKLLRSAAIEVPQTVVVSSDDLKPLVNAYQTALSVVDTKLKKEKCHNQGRLSKNKKK